MVAFNVVVMKSVPHNPFAINQPMVLVADSVLLLGLAIRSWSAGTLNKSRELTTVGPYSLVRNPLYVGSFLMMFAFCFLCKDWPTLFFVAGPMSFLYWLQVQFEEQRLARLFPSQWPEYKRKTPPFMPLRLSRAVFTGWSLAEWNRNREYQALAASAIGVLAVFAWYIGRLN